MVYINNRENDGPHELPKDDIQGSIHTDNIGHKHTNIDTKLPEEVEKLYQHFQDSEKGYELDQKTSLDYPEDTIYPQINNEIEYGLFKNVIDSYYLHSQIRDHFICTKACYTHDSTNDTLDSKPQCTHTYNHISQQLNSLADTDQQHKVYTSEAHALLFTTDTSTPCTFNIIPSNFESKNDVPTVENHSLTQVFIPIANTNIEILLVMHLHSIMILIMVIHSLSQTNILHYYSKNCRILTGVYMIP